MGESMREWRGRLLVLLAVLAIVGAACGGDDNGSSSGDSASGDTSGSSGGTSGARPRHISAGVAFDVGGLGDKSFNDAANTGLQQAIDEGLICEDNVVTNEANSTGS